MTESSEVFFVPVENATSLEVQAASLHVLLERAGFSRLINKGDTACIKMHFGEEGNAGYVSPQLVQVISAEVNACGARSICADTNTLYRGRRTNSKDHYALACSHGFSPGETGAELVIPDDTVTASKATVAAYGRLLAKVHTFRLFTDAELLVGVAHFKGHLMAGFGGALKNIGMGCATREGKLMQHCAAPPFLVDKNCVGCAACCRVCPADAITISNNRAVIDPDRCIGCASCIAACKSDAIELDWGSGAALIVEKMVEYAAAILQQARKRLFVNVATRITAECDCIATDDPRIIPDVGILASTDPVALDQASYDLSCLRAGGFDPFRKAHPRRDPLQQLDFAERAGIGVRSYTLVKVVC